MLRRENLNNLQWVLNVCNENFPEISAGLLKCVIIYLLFWQQNTKICVHLAKITKSLPICY